MISGPIRTYQYLLVFNSKYYEFVTVFVNRLCISSLKNDLEKHFIIYFKT